MQISLPDTEAGPDSDMWSEHCSVQIYRVAAGLQCQLCAQGWSVQDAAEDTMQLFLEVDPRGWRSQLEFLTHHQSDLKITGVIANISSTFSGLWTNPALCSPVCVSAGDGKMSCFFLSLCADSEPFVLVLLLQDD